MEGFNGDVVIFQVVQQNMEGLINRTAPETHFARIVTANHLPGAVVIQVMHQSPTVSSEGGNDSGAGSH